MRTTTAFAWTIAAGSAGLVAIQPVSAAVIYDGGSPNLQSAAVAYTNPPVRVAVAVPFTLAAGSDTFIGINWWGVCTTVPEGCPPAADFRVRLLAGNGKPAGTPIQQWDFGTANQTPTGRNLSKSSSTYPEYSYHASIAAQTVSPGTQYWLAFTNNEPFSDHFPWAMEASRTGASHYESTGSAPGVWIPQATFLAFNLTGPAGAALVPEPASLTLLGVGLGGSLLLRRRRIRRRA